MIETSWRAGLTGAEADEVRALAAAATEVDGTEPVSEDVLLHLAGGDAQHLLARDGATLVAFASLDVPADAAAAAGGELVVHPERRRAGIGNQVVTALIERAAGHRLNIWAHGAHPGAVALAARLGFAETRQLWRMRRSLLEPAIAEPQLAPGVRLRPFVVGADEAEFLRVNNAAFDWHPEQGGWDVEQVTVRESAGWFDAAGFLLAVDADDRVLGFHWTKVHAASGSQPAIGEVYVLGVDPSARGLHLGTALTLAGLIHLRDRGLSDVMLYVEGDNHAAIRVYEDLGFTRWDTDVSYLH
ncbi:mycothiol synthase [Pseudonocardia sp. GCM10023141]|uniref:mycothiol synthase n=1 Tax=Pseudonocardia sp. GCM10023141 TaxID=3252653 RepID=UPI00362445A9